MVGYSSSDAKADPRKTWGGNQRQRMAEQDERELLDLATLLAPMLQGGVLWAR
jgi:hypothetical protein